MHWCKWCQKRMSGAHRKHKDDPEHKSKMQIRNDIKNKTCSIQPSK